MQRSTTPEVNAALARVLDAADVKVIRVAGEGCCGSLELHLGQEQRAHATMRANVDALYEAAADAEAIISTASGCGVTVKDYGRLLADDPLYADRARSISQRTVDASEYLARIEAPLQKSDSATTVAWHSPCTLQHGQRVKGVVEGLLERAGYRLVPVANAHLCCGSAGTYSVLQHQFADATARAKARGAHRRATRRDRDRERRLPVASARRHRGARATLARTARVAERAMQDFPHHYRVATRVAGSRRRRHAQRRRTARSRDRATGGVRRQRRSMVAGNAVGRSGVRLFRARLQGHRGCVAADVDRARRASCGNARSGRPEDALHALRRYRASYGAGRAGNARAAHPRESRGGLPDHELACLRRSAWRAKWSSADLIEPVPGRGKWPTARSRGDTMRSSSS